MKIFYDSVVLSEQKIYLVNFTTFKIKKNQGKRYINAVLFVYQK
jgi:hypothetical protein